MIVATVNDYEITFNEYKAELEQVLLKLHLEQPTHKAKERAIEQLIDGYLLLQEAKQSDIGIPVDDIENEFVDFMLNYNTENEFKEMLNRNNLCHETIKEKIRNELLIKKYVSSNFQPTCDISSEKLNEMYLENKESFLTQEMVKASHILVKGDSEENLKTIREIRESIKCSEDFIRIASEWSDCPSSCQYGDLGYFTRGKMVREFEDVAFNLGINEISKPVKTEFGYHIIMITDYKESKYADFDEVKDALKKRLQRIDSELKLIRHIKELRSKADIVISVEHL